MKKTAVIIASFLIASIMTACGSANTTSETSQAEKVKETTIETTTAETKIPTNTTTVAPETTTVTTTTTEITTTEPETTTTTTTAETATQSEETEKISKSSYEMVEALEEWSSTKKYDFKKFALYLPRSYNYDSKTHFGYYGGTIDIASLGESNVQNAEDRDNLIDALAQYDSDMIIDETKYYEEDGFLIIKATQQFNEFYAYYRMICFSTSDGSAFVVILIDTNNSDRADVITNAITANMEIT